MLAEQQDQGVRVRVALRVRPAIILNQPQTPGKERPITRTSVQIVPDEPQVVIGKDESSQKTFTFDFVFGPPSTQEEIYQELASPLVEQFLQGFNATILAYGQTFSGKTYTMGSSNDSDTPAADCGIIPRAFYDIMTKLPSEETGSRCLVKVSFLEIYQEQIRDLLMPQSTNREISVRENKGQIVLSGVHEEVVESIEDLSRCLVAGGIERTTGDTLMHLHSSRSHALFTITLELVQDSVDEYQPPVVVRRSKLHLVDLAGSERLKRTGAEGVRLRESVKINSGLLALGNVISILGDEKHGDSDRQTHVPYRDSKLTRLLQDSLGGNSQTLMLACVSPLQEDTDETINTMKYAYRARKIQNKPILNVIDQLAMDRTNMQQKIDHLEGKLRGLEENGAGPVPFDPEMIDFDNDQWMQFFMVQLKNRTKKGATAVKALEEAKKEIEQLKEQIVTLEEDQSRILQSSINDFAQEKGNAMQGQIEELQLSHDVEMASVQQSLDILLAFSIKTFRGESHSDADLLPVKQLIKQHFPIELAELERSASKESLACTTFPPINQNSNTRAPSTNSVARTMRRKRITSVDLREDSESAANLKPLEMELRETRRYLSQMEDELNRTKIRLHQTEAISEKSSFEITRLMELNDSLRSGKVVERDPSYNPQEIVSIKVLADAAIQTSATQIENKEEDVEEQDDRSIPSDVQQSYPVFSSSPQEMNVERLADELSIATKVKVDLLKELSKVNKEAEKTRHAHQDQVFKLEREVESLQREMNKLIEDHHEKDLLKDRAKDEHERKIKHQESTIQKYKQKQKELEKTLKEKGSGDKRLQDYQQDIEKLTIQIAGLKKKIKEDHDKFQEMENRKSKEIAVINKQLEEEAKKSRQLEMKSEMMRKKLDRKTEEIATIGKKTRDSSITSSNTIHRGRASLAGQISCENFDMPEVDTGANASFSIQAADLPALQGELKSARERMQSIEIEMETSSTQGTKFDTLQKNKSDAVLQIANLRNEIRKKEHEALLLKEFSSELESIAPLFTDNQKIQRIIQHAPAADISSCRASLVECLKELLPMQKQIQGLQSEIHAQVTQSENDKGQVAMLEKRLQKVIRAYEKKLLELQKEFKDAHQEPQLDIRPISVSSEAQTDAAITESLDTSVTLPPIVPTADLEKDVFYYRNINKELKSKLREVVAVNHRLAKTLKKQAEASSSQENDGANPSFPVAV